MKKNQLQLPKPFFWFIFSDDPDVPSSSGTQVPYSSETQVPSTTRSLATSAPKERTQSACSSTAEALFGKFPC